MQKSPVPVKETGAKPQRPRHAPPRTPDTDPYYKTIAARFRAAKYGTFAVLIAFLIFSFTFLRNDITLENLRYLLKFISFTNTETSITVPKIHYDSGDPNRLELFVGDLVTLTKDGYALYDSRGNQIMSEDISLNEPVLRISSRYALCYDLGGYNFHLLNTFAKLYDGTTEYPITDAAVSDTGSFAVASSTREYRTQVMLYDENFKPVSRVLKNDHLMALEMKPDGSEAAIMTSAADGGSFYTRIELVAPGADSAIRAAEINGLGYAFYFTEGGYAAVTDEAICFFDEQLEMRAAIPHASAPAMTHSSGRYITRITSDGIIGNNYTLEIFDLSGKLAYRGNFTGKLSAAASDETGDYIFVLAGNQVIRVNLYNKKIGSVTVEQDAIDVLPLDPDSFLLALKNYALTYDVTFDEAYYDRP